MHGHDWILDLVIKTFLLRRKRSQVVCLPEDVAFPDGVREVVVFREGKRRVLVPADSSWDDFVDEPRIDIGERKQPT